MSIQISLISNQSVELCPTCNLGMEKIKIYENDRVSLNGVTVELKSFHCGHCKETITIINCALCGKPFRDRYPKGKIDCEYSFLCEECKRCKESELKWN